jgi:hypothetical protein
MKCVRCVGMNMLEVLCAPVVDPVIDEGAPICQMSLEVSCNQCGVWETLQVCTQILAFSIQKPTPPCAQNQTCVDFVWLVKCFNLSVDLTCPQIPTSLLPSMATT